MVRLSGTIERNARKEDGSKFQIENRSNLGPKSNAAIEALIILMRKPFRLPKPTLIGGFAVILDFKTRNGQSYVNILKDDCFQHELVFK